MIMLRHWKGCLVDKAWRDVVKLVDMVVDGCVGCLKLFFVAMDIRAANFEKVALSAATFCAILTQLINI